LKSKQRRGRVHDYVIDHYKSKFVHDGDAWD
jgi:hypothetical protein